MTIRTLREGFTTTVTIANPESLNALFLADLDTLADLWDELDADERVRVVVLTGEGDRAFCRMFSAAVEYRGIDLNQVLAVLS